MKRATTLADLERVYRENFRAFTRTAVAYLGDLDAAYEAVQEGVALAISKRRTYRGDAPLEAWVWRIVLNAIRDRHRERAHAAVLTDEGAEAPSPAQSNGHMSTEAVGWAVRRLPERQRLVLFLRFYADMDYATIASLLNMSEGTVGASLNAARATLRDLMEGVRT